MENLKWITIYWEIGESLPLDTLGNMPFYSDDMQFFQSMQAPDIEHVDI